MLARFDLPATLADAAALAPNAEAAQPLYARYWLHNRGPAPLGACPRSPTCTRRWSARSPAAT